MNNSKRQQQESHQQGLESAPPTIPVNVPPPSPSPTEEHQAWQRRRALFVGGLAALLVLFAIAVYLLWPRTAVVAPLSPNAPQVPVAVVPQPPGAVAPVNGSGIQCVAIDGLPVLEDARCIEQNRDEDDGKLENTYVVETSADDVRRFFEGQFQQNGWQTHQAKFDEDDMIWSYEIAQGERRVDLKVEGDQDVRGPFTRIEIEEK